VEISEVIVPSVDGPPPEPGRSRRRTWVYRAFIGLGVLVVLGLIALAAAPFPYVSLSPGSATPTVPLITVNGAPTYPAQGQILYLTVSVDYRVTGIEVFHSWFDHDIQVNDKQKELGNQTPAQDRQASVVQMTQSKDTAVLLALSKLGEPVTVTGTGAVVSLVASGAPADGKLAVNDVVVALNGKPVTLSNELVDGIRALTPGTPAVLTLDKGGTKQDVTVTLGRKPEQATGDPNLDACKPVEGSSAPSTTPTVACVGIAAGTRSLDQHLPYDVSIDTNKVGGPSAGLAFTLSIMDLLTPSELTGGHKVAITGAIGGDGSVQPVGGVKQKTAAAIAAGAQYMIVPDGEQTAAIARAGHSLKVVPVKTLDDALAVLQCLGGNVTDVLAQAKAKAAARGVNVPDPPASSACPAGLP
jgi:Lon-like protease